mgnify:CR=1 FL=1
MLKELGIVIGDDTKAGNIFESLFSDFMDFEYETSMKVKMTEIQT